MKLFCRTWVAISYGLLLSCVHTIISVVLLDTELHLVAQWQTVIANIIILITVNLVGIFIHNLTEEGQRRAFLDTRDCIAAKLEMEDENEKLVSKNKRSRNWGKVLLPSPSIWADILYTKNSVLTARLRGLMVLNSIFVKRSCY